jgi:transcriptional regulator with PAS, ATPase and Fis domain
MDDFPLIVNHFIELFNKKFKKEIQQFSAQAFDILMDYDWPGNIRELENVIEHCFVLCSGKIIQVECLPKRLREQKKTTITSSNAIQKNGFKDVERELIISVLEKHNGNRTKAAKELNINPSTLWRKIKKLGI